MDNPQLKYSDRLKAYDIKNNNNKKNQNIQFCLFFLNKNGNT